MTVLELIYQLEKHYAQLEEYKSDLEILKKSVKIKTLEAKHRQIEEYRLSLMSLLDKTRKELLLKEANLKNSTFMLKEIEKNLYDGSISDFKQLAHLSQEREGMEKLTKDTEDDIIDLLERIDEILSNITSYDFDIDNLKSKIMDIKKIYISKSDELIERINEENKKIDEYSNKIAPDILNRYNNIRKKKKSGIVKLVDNICTGCNMVISSYDFEKVKKKNEIVYCESCGRILYYVESNKE